MSARQQGVCKVLFRPLEGHQLDVCWYIQSCIMTVLREV